MSFTDQKPWIATEKDCALNWGGGGKGARFRCGLCGYKFKPGDTVRWQFTNNIPHYGGNPLVCSTCDGPDIIDKWKAHCDSFKLFKEKYWHEMY
jgi:hypothetical protein